MKQWLKLVMITEPVLVEAIADFLVGIVGAGVEVGVDEHIYLKTVNAYVEKENLSEAEISGIVGQVAEHSRELAEIFQVNPPELSYRTIEEEDWGRNWKKHFRPFAITEGLVIAPSWERYEPKSGEKVVVMDPGMAFGTGHHATTALALQLLRDELAQAPGDHCVLDVGTGTGILGMAAALFGARRVLGTDNDPVAVAIARENIEKNNLSATMTASDVPLDQLDGTYSLVVANIVYDVLAEMAGDLHRITAPGGRLILSGILEEGQADAIVACYRGLGFRLAKRSIREEWAALLFQKGKDPKNLD